MSDVVRVSKPEALEILDYDRSGVIEASAGTGKTYTIEHMVVDLILEENVPISRILVVTFTERATAELVLRVRKILRTIRTKKEDTIEDPDEPHWTIDEDARDRLNQALLSFDRAPVHTIHSFCNRVLNEHAFPNRRPFEQEQVDSGELFDRVFPEVLREVLARDPDYAPVLRAFIAENSIESLRDTIRQSTGTWEEIRPRITSDELDEFEQRLSTFVEDFDTYETRIRRALDEGSVGSRSQGKVSRVLEDFCQAVNAYRENSSLWRFLGTLRRVTTDKPFDYFVGTHGDKDWMPDAMVETLGLFREAQLSPKIVVVNQFAREVEDRLDREKNEEGLYTYDDMLEMVKEGLTGPSAGELKQTLRSEFDYAIIDEFQDTDPRQWTIFREIFFESGSDNPCYLIGDPKQAIYGFRGADVRTYREATDRVREANDGDNWVSLDTNYRSTPELIDGYNRILGPDEAGSFFDEEGNNSYETPVDAGFEQKWFGPDEDNPATPVVIPSLSHPVEDETIKARSYERLLGRYYADEIKRLLESDAPRISGDDGEDPEPITGEDIFVLVNKTKEARLVGRYLEEKDVPYSFYKEDGLFESEQARHLFQVLQAALEPGNRSRRLMAWHTPFFDVDLEELERVDRITDEDHPLFERLMRWNRWVENDRVGRLVHSVLHDSGVLRRAVYRNPGERALTNYQQLGDRLIQSWQEDSLTAEEVNARLGRLVRGDQNPGEKEDDTKHLESNESAVQIMTMHKSKGLEAPVVFLYGGWGSGNKGPDTFYPEDGDGRVKYFGSSARGTPYYDEIKAYEREEAERLLYVSMTRAEGRLYLPYVPSDEYGRGPGGRIKVLFDRLEDFLEPSPEEAPASLDEELFEVIEPDLIDEYPPIVDPAQPAESDLELPDDIETFEDVEFGRFRANRQLYIESYSSVTRAQASREHEEDEEFIWGEKEPIGGREESELPAGRVFGQFVHELLEFMDYEYVETCRQEGGFDAWAQASPVRDRLERTRTKFGIDAEHDEAVLELIWDTLTRSVGSPDGPIEALSSVENRQKELEFWVPIPEEDHPGLAEPYSGLAGETAGVQQGLFDTEATHRPFEVEQGYLRGYVDYVFEWDGKIYAADWKTDTFDTKEDYAPDALAERVQDHYGPQQTFYTYALMRLLQRTGEDLEDRFGGLFYFFVRGLSREERTPDTGVYFARPEPDAYDSILDRTKDLSVQSIRQKKESIRRDE